LVYLKPIGMAFYCFSNIRRKVLEMGEFGVKLREGKLILVIVRHLFVLPGGDGSLVQS
jgi:hypothetical protein